MDWCGNRQARAGREGGCRFYDVVDGVFFHFLAAHRRDGASDACEKQSQIVVYFGRSAHGASRIACAHLLLYGYGRRKPFYEVALRFGHLAHELAGVGAEAFHVSPLSFGVKCVESK